MTYQALSIVRRDALATVTLQRPDRLNALNATLIRELTAAAGELGADASVRAVVLTGAGSGFCAGADLTPGELPVAAGASRGAATRRVLLELFNPLALAWAGLPKPVVVAVNGVAAGGGVGLALTGDILLLARSARLIQVFVPKLGLVPDVGVSYFLPRAIGAPRARALVLLGTALDAEQAVDWGLAHEVVDDAALLERSEALAATLAAGPTRAIAAAKALLGGGGSELAAQLAREADCQGMLADTEDHAEGMAAFAARRAPTFRGR